MTDENRSDRSCNGRAQWGKHGVRCTDLGAPARGGLLSSGLARGISFGNGDAVDVYDYLVVGDGTYIHTLHTRMRSR